MSNCKRIAEIKAEIDERTKHLNSIYNESGKNGPYEEGEYERTEQQITELNEELAGLTRESAGSCNIMGGKRKRRRTKRRKTKRKNTRKRKMSRRR